MSADALAGRTVALPEARELDVFAGLLERRGASVWRCPLVSIVDASDPAPVLAWLRRFVAGDCDDLILLTGEGLRRLQRCIEQHEPMLLDRFVARLGAVRKITRGPKPARALRALGLKSDIEATTPTTGGIIERLAIEALHGRRVGVQLYGSEPNLPLIDFLRAAGATPLPVSPYAYATASDDEAVNLLLTAMLSGAIDAIAFTSMAQVDRLFSVPTEASVLQALRAVEVVAVGPVVAAALEQRGATVDAMPTTQWSMKPLAAEICRLFGPPSSQSTGQPTGPSTNDTVGAETQ
jgi:uroporphyrinogen-III synthase